MKASYRTERPLDPPDDGLDEDEIEAREDAREREADRRHDAEAIYGR